MEHEGKRPVLNNIFGYIKNIFWILLVLQLVPLFFGNIKNAVADVMSPKAHVGYLTIKGEITDASFYVKKIDEFAKDDEIQALLVRIDSSGGYSGTSQIIFNELKRFKKNKPIVALIENVGASGAYYIAAAANKIVASPQSLVGSIGTVLQVPNVKELLASWKVRFYEIHSGSYKTAGSPVKDMTDEDLAYLQTLSDDHYDLFVKDIAEARGLDVADHKKWADGKPFTGRQGLELKLIDKLGSFSDALDELKIVANIEEEIKLVAAKKPGSVMQWLSGSDDSDGSTQSFTDLVASHVGSALAKNVINCS